MFNELSHAVYHWSTATQGRKVPSRGSGKPLGPQGHRGASHSTFWNALFQRLQERRSLRPQMKSPLVTRPVPAWSDAQLLTCQASEYRAVLASSARACSSWTPPAPLWHLKLPFLAWGGGSTSHRPFPSKDLLPQASLCLLRVCPILEL